MSSPGVQSSAYLRHAIRRVFETCHHAQNDPTASILRYTTSGGDPFKSVAPAAVLVAGLAALRVVVDRPGFFEGRSRAPTGIQIEEGDREFWFLDIPATTGVPANRVQATDRILFQSEEWYPLEGSVENDDVIACSVAICRLTKRA